MVTNASLKMELIFAKKLLDEKKINYQEINLYEEPDKREDVE